MDILSTLKNALGGQGGDNLFALRQAYTRYVLETQERGETPMSFEAWVRQIQQRNAQPQRQGMLGIGGGNAPSGLGPVARRLMGLE